MGAVEVPLRQIIDGNGNTVAFTGSAITIATNIESLGNLTIGTSQVAVAFTGTTQSIIMRSLSTNTGIIYIGTTGVQNDGTLHFAMLYPGENLTIEYNDATNAIYAISDTAAQKLSAGALLGA
jgi:hypothetical protein